MLVVDVTVDINELSGLVERVSRTPIDKLLVLVIILTLAVLLITILRLTSKKGVTNG